MNSSSKIVLNTAVLYGQLLVGMALGLYTTRLVLNALGETDFGIYMLVAGVVGMLGILNSNMSNTSMRFMAHSLGSDNIELTRKTFNTTLFLHFVIGVIVVLIMEGVGVYLIYNVLNIPPAKIFEASIVFHFMVLTTFVTIIAVPYDAVMNSHENLSALAVVDIIGYILKLAIAIYLTYIDTNLLITYGLLMFLVQISQRIIKQVYSKRKYVECKISFRNHIDRKMMREILSFTGWNLFGSIASMSAHQVRTILINMFFGVRLNAAEGIANRASSTVNMVSSSMSRAINPQLMKSEGGGDRARMLKITEIGTKFSSFLFAIFAIPILLEAPYLLKIWLKSVPDFSVIFVQLILISMLIEKFSFQITHSIRAIGKIRAFQLTETAIIVLIVPLAYFAFYYGYPPVSIYIIGLVLNFFIFFERLYFGKKIANIEIIPFFKNAIIPILIPIVISLLATLAIRMLFDANIFRLITVSFIYILMLTILFWFMGINQYERMKLKGVYISILSKIKK
jgi:Na+-driven multidrug efflux pump